MQQGGGIRSRIGKDMLKRFFRVVLMIGATPIIMMMGVTFPMQRCVGQILRASMIKLHPLTTACEGLEQDGEQQDSGEKLTEHDLESWSQILGNVPLWQRTLRVSHTDWWLPRHLPQGFLVPMRIYARRAESTESAD